MGVWPFRRRSNRRPSRHAGNISRPGDENMLDAGTHQVPSKDNDPDPIPTGPRRRKSRTDSRGKRKSSRDSKKLEKRRTYSFSTGRNDSILVTRDADRPPVPPLPANLGGIGAPDAENLLRSRTHPPENPQVWERAPTLHKRSAQEMSRRKSSKKRKEEHTREAEIKAMASSMPTRPATDADLSGRPMKRESKRMRDGMSRSLQNPSSDISLPTAASIESSLSSTSRQLASYKVSSFDMLAPRPTIRYSENPRFVPGASFSSDYQVSKNKRVAERVSIPEETLKANKRIDDLADDLNAGELRELMERDQKRREQKKAAEMIKAEKKLARRQQKQREDEETAKQTGSPPPANMERGVLGRELVGLDTGASSRAAIVASDERIGPTTSEDRGGKRPANGSERDSKRPANNSNISATEDTSAVSRHLDPSESVPRGPVDKANISRPSSPTTRAPVQDASQMVAKQEALTPRASTSSALAVPSPPAGLVPLEPTKQNPEGSTRPPQSWTAFFKKGTKPKQVPTPSFSNTSRDSMQNSQGPQVGYTPVKTASNLPKRTMSKFREDLPELPISPPDSRMQSPEADAVPPIREDYSDNRFNTQPSSDDPPIRYDTPSWGHRSLETGRLRDETPTSGHRSIDAASLEPTALSQSLASIDSEGSWLSGGKGSKRGSAQLPPYPRDDSASSLHKRYKDFSESTEELGIVGDAYFSRLTPSAEDRQQSRRRSSGNPMPSSDDDSISPTSPIESERSKWGAVARQPTVVHHAPRAKSREGLLNDFEFDSGSEPIGEAHGDENEVPGVHRAMSVDLGIKHARHISAGSARLLELKARSSGEGKRPSISSDRT